MNPTSRASRWPVPSREFIRWPRCSASECLECLGFWSGSASSGTLGLMRIMRWGVLCAVLLVVAVASPAQAAAEHIRGYEADLAIRADGVLHVHEAITYDFAGAEDRHGIERVIPYRDGQRVYDIENVRVTDGGQHAEAHISHSRGALTVRIGDGDVRVQGVRTYVIDYDVAHALTPRQDDDELYWDAIGTGWNVPIDAATVRVSAPAVPAYAGCFAGREGAHDACGVPTLIGTSTSFGRRLGAHQGMTVKIKLPKGAVHVPPPRYERPLLAVTWVGATMLGGFCALLLAAAALVRWRRHPHRPVSDLPALARPAEAVYLVHRAGPSSAAAILVDLAVRGHLHITDDGESFTLTRRPSTEPLLPHERALLETVLGDDSEVQVGEAQRSAVGSLRLSPMIYDTLRARGLIRRFAWHRVCVPLGIVGLAAGAVLITMDLWGRLSLRAFSLGDLTAAGVTCLMAGAVALFMRRQISRLTFAGARIRALAAKYNAEKIFQPFDDERLLPYTMAFWSRFAISSFGAANFRELDWYTYTGNFLVPGAPGNRFGDLIQLFHIPEDESQRQSGGWPHDRPTRESGAGSSSSTTHLPHSHGGGYGGGSVGGGAGGGGGGSW